MQLGRSAAVYVIVTEKCALASACFRPGDDVSRVEYNEHVYDQVLRFLDPLWENTDAVDQEQVS